MGLQRRYSNPVVNAHVRVGIKTPGVSEPWFLTEAVPGYHPAPPQILTSANRL